MRDQEIVGLWEAYSSIYQKDENEFETWVNDLVEEGYDLSDYTWNDMYEMFMNLDEGDGRAREGFRFDYNQRHGRPFITPETSQRASETETLGGGTYQRGPKRLPRKKRKYDQQVLSGVRAASEQEKQRARERLGIRESFDYILEHLIAEGYADTNDAALSIMANMSEEWKQSILEADSLAAQRARREARLARQRKREGRPSGGGDFGHDYSKPRAQADAEREERMRKFINKEESIVGDLLDEGEKPFPDEKVKAKQVALRSQGGDDALKRRMKMGLARRRAKEARRTGGSQQSAGAGWYHGR